MTLCQVQGGYFQSRTGCVCARAWAPGGAAPGAGQDGSGCLGKDYSLGLVKEEVDDVVSPFGVVEEHEERPVDQPGPLLQGLERRAYGLERERGRKSTNHKKPVWIENHVF